MCIYAYLTQKQFYIQIFRFVGTFWRQIGFIEKFMYYLICFEFLFQFLKDILKNYKKNICVYLIYNDTLYKFQFRNKKHSNFNLEIEKIIN